MKTLLSVLFAATVASAAVVSPAFGQETCTKGKTTIETAPNGNVIIRTPKICTITR